MKKSKITSCKFVKTWSGERGTVYYHDLEFENGDKGQAGFNKEEPAEYAVGTEHEYEITTNGSYAAKIKIVKPNASGGAFGGRKATVNNAGFALSYAKDILIASMHEGSKIGPLSTKEMFNVAEKMYAWLEARKS